MEQVKQHAVGKRIQSRTSGSKNAGNGLMSGHTLKDAFLLTNRGESCSSEHGSRFSRPPAGLAAARAATAMTMLLQQALHEGGILKAKHSCITAQDVYFVEQLLILSRWSGF